jgi:hypothetical protein
MDQQRIPQSGRTLIVYFCPNHNRAIALFQHFAERPSKFLGQERPIRFDKSQVSDIVHQAAGVRVEKHHTNFCL